MSGLTSSLDDMDQAMHMDSLAFDLFKDDDGDDLADLGASFIKDDMVGVVGDDLKDRDDDLESDALLNGPMDFSHFESVDGIDGADVEALDDLETTSQTESKKRKRKGSTSSIGGGGSAKLSMDMKNNVGSGLSSSLSTASFSNSNSKRSRGRPPSFGALPPKTKAIPGKNFNFKGDDFPAESVALTTTANTANNSSSNNNNNGSSNASKAGADGGENQDTPKQPKLPPTIVTQKVLGKLMTDDPLSITDLAKMLPEATKDSIQAVLEVLQVMGIVVGLRCKDPYAMSSFSSLNYDMDSNHNNGENGMNVHSIPTPSSSQNSSTVFYSIIGFAKGVEPLDFRRLDTVLKENQQNIDTITKRIHVLEDFANRILPHQEKMYLFKNTLESMMQKDSHMMDDLLYRILYEQVVQSCPVMKWNGR